MTFGNNNFYDRLDQTTFIYYDCVYRFMAHINTDTRASKILQVIAEIENSPLTVNQYFKAKNPPFGRAQYYLYKKALRVRGEAGLHDLRSKGNNLKFTNEMKNFAKGLIEYNMSMTSSEVLNAIKNEF